MYVENISKIDMGCPLVLGLCSFSEVWTTTNVDDTICELRHSCLLVRVIYGEVGPTQPLIVEPPTHQLPNFAVVSCGWWWSVTNYS